jgi:hypothetical protein
MIKTIDPGRNFHVTGDTKSQIERTKAFGEAETKRAMSTVSLRGERV